MEAPSHSHPIEHATGNGSDAPQSIGLLAAWGRFPVHVAQTLKASGHRVICVGVTDHADPVLAEICDAYTSLGVGKLGSHIRFFRRHGVTTATMAGKLFKHKLLYNGHWIRHAPDWTSIKTYFPHFITKKKDMTDDSMLLAAVKAFQSGGIALVPATDFAPELLIESGQIAGAKLSHAQRKDVEFGWRLAKEMGRLDVGQTVAVKSQAVLAIEAIEGTDQCIRRAGELCKRGGFTVVKVAKPQQDMRFDVPTIGRGTIESLVAAGAGVLAVEAGKTIIIDHDDVVAQAERQQLSIIAVAEEDFRELQRAA